MHKKSSKIKAAIMRSLFVVLCLFSTIQLTLAEALETSAKQAFMIDAETGTVFLNKNADKTMPPASMAKLMTLAVVFDALVSNKIKLDQSFKISENAWRTGGAPSRTTSMFAKVKSEVPVADLVRSVIIQSANDAAIALAEGLSGSEEAFVEEMNLYAKKIGLETSRFYNSTGLPHEQQVVTARELSVLALHLIKTYPQFLPIFSERSFEWNNIFQKNKNRLIGKDLRVDGLKTGYTEQSAHGIVVSALHYGRRVILVLNGIEKRADLITETKKLLDYAYDGVHYVNLFNENHEIGKASIFGGQQPEVAVHIKEDINLYLPYAKADQFKAEFNYEAPLIAPIEADTEIGSFKIFYQDNVLKELPIYTTKAVEKSSISAIAKNAASNWIWSKIPPFKISLKRVE